MRKIGRLDGAKQQYLDALKREQHNRKALLSLALLAFESGNQTAATSYIQQALRYHSGESEVHYLAAYIDSRAGKLAEAERRARAAVQIKKDYTEAKKWFFKASNMGYAKALNMLQKLQNT